jgi:dephospho-CoA kinase
MKIIGLTGTIGSGKSSVAHILEELGAACIDADKVGHEVYNPGTPGWKELVETFGKEIVSPEGTIDRKKLSKIVFKNPVSVVRLNQLLHPKIRREVENRLDQYRKQGKEVGVVEATLLIEAGWMDMLDELWVVTAPREATLKRLKERGLSEAEALARLAAQTPAEKMKPYAKTVIDNKGNLEDLKAQVVKLWQKIHDKSRE